MAVVIALLLAVIIVLTISMINLRAKHAAQAARLKDIQKKTTEMLEKLEQTEESLAQLEGYANNPLWIARKLKKLINSHDKLEPEVSIDSPLGKIILGLKVDRRFHIEGIDYYPIEIKEVPMGSIGGNWG